MNFKQFEALNLPDYDPDDAEQTKMQNAIRDMVEEDQLSVQELLDYFAPKLRHVFNSLSKIYQPIELFPLRDILRTKNGNPDQTVTNFYKVIEDLQRRMRSSTRLIHTLSNSDIPEVEKRRTEHKWIVLYAMQICEFLMRPDIRAAFHQAARNK